MLLPAHLLASTALKGTVVQMIWEVHAGFLGGQKCSHLPESFPESPKGNARVAFREGEGKPAQAGGAFLAVQNGHPCRSAQCRQKPTSVMAGRLPGEKRGRDRAGGELPEGGGCTPSHLQPEAPAPRPSKPSRLSAPVLGAGALRTIKVSSFSSISLIKKTRSNPNDASQEKSKNQIKPLFLFSPGILFSRLQSMRNGPFMPSFPS